jgi:hypothetical protein
MMATTTQPPTDIKEYGNAKKEAQDAEGLAATAAMEAETTPTLQPPEAEAAPEQPAPEQEADEVAPPNQPTTQPRNLMQLVPPELLFRDKVKNPAKQDRDVAMLYEVLASSPYSSDLTKVILSRLRGE